MGADFDVAGGVLNPLPGLGLWRQGADLLFQVLCLGLGLLQGGGGLGQGSFGLLQLLGKGGLGSDGLGRLILERLQPAFGLGSRAARSWFRASSSAVWRVWVSRVRVSI